MAADSAHAAAATRACVCRVQTLSRGSDYGGGCLPWLYERSLERYLICDVIWSKGDSYRHNVWRLTKAGRRYERGGHTWLSPSSRIRMTQCGDVLPEQPERHCASFDGTQMHSLKEPATEGTSTISLNGCRSERLEELERSTYRLFVCVVRTNVQRLTEWQTNARAASAVT